MLTPPTLPHRLDRTVLIQAEPETVFTFFENSDRWASWWGAGSTIDARVGGRVVIRHPGGTEVTGEVREVRRPERIVFTYDVAAVATATPTSLVTIRLEKAGGGATRLYLTHEFADQGMRDEHVQGWRYQLALFGNLVADVALASAAESVDDWFAAWSDPNDSARDTVLARVAAPTVRFRDRFSLIDGIDDLKPHLAAVHRFMPGMRIARDGDIRHCQGTVLADWIARGPDAQERGRGTNVFTFGENQRIDAVTGFWNKP
jgi:uncharacterized protein YndB with AHSA1/START domain